MIFRVLFIFQIFIFLFLTGCVVGFSNSQNHITVLYSKIYLPAANDSSVYSGNSSRLTFAVRDALARRTDIQLTSLENARVALKIKIIGRQQSITVVDNCRNGGYVANGAFACTEIHPELNGQPDSKPTSFNQPYISPSSESLYLVVNAKAIDLNNGQVIWQNTYYVANISPAAFNEIGDPGDNRTINNMANKPDLHALRYQESVDNAVQSFSNSVASSIVSSLLSSIPKN